MIVAMLKTLQIRRGEPYVLSQSEEDMDLAIATTMELFVFGGVQLVISDLS